MKNKLVKVSIAVLTCVVMFCLGITVTNIFKSSSSLEAQKWETIHSLIQDKWYFGKKDLTMEEALLEAFTTGEDRFTHYNKVPEKSTAETLYGIGVSYGIETASGLLKEKGLAVMDVDIDSPSYNKIFKFDCVIGRVIESENISFIGIPYEEAIGYVRGKINDTLTLIIKRGEEIINVDITISTYAKRYVKQLENIESICSTCVGVTVTNFENTTATQLKTYFDSLGDVSNVDLYMNFRNNGGGYITIYEALVDLFLEKNLPLSISEERENKRHIIAQTKDDFKYNFNSITIHVNGNSASATEAFSLAMRFYQDKLNKFQIIGTKTYGKGIAQTEVNFYDGSSFTYTFAKLFDPSGLTSIHGVGLEPDTIVSEPNIGSYSDIFTYARALDEVIDEGLGLAKVLGGLNG